MSNGPLQSTGRGGAGNIGHDPNVYADAGIVREGVQGESGEPEYSSGRGGAGNIVASPRIKPTGHGRPDQDIIPETALREHQENYHTGRGGEGNIHKDKYGGHSHDPNRETIIDKVKHIIHPKKEEKPSSSS